jgi:hypothetical protein
VTCGEPGSLMRTVYFAPTRRSERKVTVSV